MWAIPTNCPGLHELRLFDGREIVFDDFERYLQRFSHLRALDLSCLAEQSMTVKVLFHLASLPRLEKLCLKMFSKGKEIQVAFQRLSPRTPFQQLQYLDVRTDSQTISLLIPSLNAPTTLRLCVNYFGSQP